MVKIKQKQDKIRTETYTKTENWSISLKSIMCLIVHFKICEFGKLPLIRLGMPYNMLSVIVWSERSCKLSITSFD